MTRWISLLLPMLLGTAAVPAADIYRWVDDQGKVHFGDRPPSSEVEQVDLPEDKPMVDAEQQRLDRERRRVQQRLLDSYQEDRQQQQQQRQKSQTQEAQRERECTRARNRLARYENSGGLYEPLPDGGQRLLSWPERRAETEKARQEVRRWCSQ